MVGLVSLSCNYVINLCVSLMNVSRESSVDWAPHYYQVEVAIETKQIGTKHIPQCMKTHISTRCSESTIRDPGAHQLQYILVYPALDYPAPRLTGRVSLPLKGEKALSNKPPSFRFSAIVLMKV